MALINCWECGKEISDAAPVCPGCGAPATKAPDISIHKAAERGNIEAVKQHIAAGMDVNAKYYNMACEPPLESGCLPLNWLRRRGLDGRAPLHYAANGGHKEIAELLIAKGADVNVKGGFTINAPLNWTPLHSAAESGHKEIVELLIGNGADVNEKNKYGRIPLHYAARWGHKEITEILIAEGADVNAKSDFGTPLDAAIDVWEWCSHEERNAKKETADLLRKHGGKTSEELETEGK